MTQAYNLAQLANNLNTSGQLDASDGLFGIVPINNGGTGQNTANAALNSFLPNQSGNSGKFLTTNGTNTSWGNVGKVLQVLQTVITSQVLLYPGTTWPDIPGFSASITPSSSSSKILVIAEIRGGSNTNMGYRLVRNSTPIYLGTQTGSAPRTPTSSGDYFISSATAINQAANMTFLDSPATTSSTTYKIQAWTFSTAYYLQMNMSYGGADASYVLTSPSSITLMEIAA